jgi:hypothetical protein
MTGGSTASGRRARASATWSRTSWIAPSRSVPSSNSISMRAMPWYEVERSVRTFAMELRRSSRTSVTSSSMPSGDAPSSRASTVTTGKSISGYWSTPRRA